MKKFIKRRRNSKDRNVAFRVGSPYMESSSGIESDFLEYDAAASSGSHGNLTDGSTAAPTFLENQKLKASIGRLAQENSRLKEQLENRVLIQTYEEAEVSEIRNLAAKLVTENEQLEHQLTLCRTHTAAVEASLEDELQSLMDKMANIEDHRDQSDQQFLKLLLEHETLRKMLQEQEESKEQLISIKEHKAVIGGLKELLAKLRKRYEAQTKAIHVQLIKSENERKRLVAEVTTLKTSLQHQKRDNAKVTSKLKTLSGQNSLLLEDTERYRKEVASLQHALDDLLRLTGRNIGATEAYKGAVQSELEKMSDKLSKVNLSNLA